MALSGGEKVTQGYVTDADGRLVLAGSGGPTSGVTIENSTTAGAEVLASAPGSDTGQRALAVRVISSLAGGGGGGGAVTVADGADVAQGATTDLSSANTVVGLLKAIKAAITGTLTVAGSLGRSWTLSSGTDSVNVGNFPASQAVTGPLTDTQLRATAVPVSDGGGSLTVDGTVAVSGSVAVTGPLTDTQLRATAVPVADGGGSLTVDGSVSVSNFPAVQPVSDNAGSLTVDAPVGTPVFVRLSDGAAAIATLPVSLASVPAHGVTDNGGTLTVDDGGLTLSVDDGAGSLTVDGSVSVSNFPGTQAVSGTVTANAGTGTFATLETRPSSSTLTNFTGSGASQTIAASNANRRMLTIYNDSGVTAYVKFGATASSTSFTVKMVDQSYYEVPNPVYTGVVDALWASGAVRVTEIT